MSRPVTITWTETATDQRSASPGTATSGVASVREHFGCCGAGRRRLKPATAPESTGAAWGGCENGTAKVTWQRGDIGSGDIECRISWSQLSTNQQQTLVGQTARGTFRTYLEARP